MLEWTNKSEPAKTLPVLSHELRILAAQTDVKQLADYAPPSVFELAAVTNDIQAAKAMLPSGLITYEAGKRAIALNPSSYWSIEQLADFAIKEKQNFNNMPMILIVRKPDYLGTTKWQFRHGKRPISASMEDAEWLKRFQARAVDVRPGDGLKCLVDTEFSYSHENELVGENYTIKKVVEVLENQHVQGTFFGDA